RRTVTAARAARRDSRFAPSCNLERTMLFRSSRRRHTTSTRKRPIHLRLEQLENRTVPSAVLWTDKADYAPGSPAIINGSGFLVGETVQIQVLHTDGLPNDEAAHQPSFVTNGGAGDLDGVADGKFQTTWTMDADATGSAFQVTATGQTSGEIAQTTFTDKF